MTRTMYARGDAAAGGRQRNGLPGWLVPTGLVLLAVIPALGGGARLADLASDPVVTEANARFVAAPVPVVAHIIAATAFTAVGAFQFGRRRSGAAVKRHRRFGRALLPLGGVAAATGLWMTLTYPWPAGDGLALYLIRLVFGGAMLASVIAGAVSIVRRDYRQHGAWMTRAYAIGAGAGTQALLLVPVTIAIGPPPEVVRTPLMGAAWVINVLVAEWVIQRRASGRAARSGARGRGAMRSAVTP